MRLHWLLVISSDKVCDICSNERREIQKFVNIPFSADFYFGAILEVVLHGSSYVFPLLCSFIIHSIIFYRHGPISYQYWVIV